MPNKPFYKKRRFKVPLVFVATIGVLCGYFYWKIQIPFPYVSQTDSPQTQLIRTEIAPNHYAVGNNWLKKNEFGLWEMYIEGAPYQRGLVYGVLAKELMDEQEMVFIEQIKQMIPSQTLLKYLRYFIGWFNRDIHKYIPQENQEEIFGISKSFSDEFSFIGDNYYRILNYHAAHDIGHALADLNIVGCTSFAIKDTLSVDQSLLIARNFDFNMGDNFAKNKVILFIKPDEGHAFASISWAGFTGVVSGINEKGLTVTLNAAKSDIPLQAKTPISILAREILQYATTLEEAIQIAKMQDTFVSESILVGSKHDNKAIVIEKTPTQLAIYDSNSPLLICSNHYQSDHFLQDDINLNNIKLSDSKYRFDRMQELLKDNYPLTVSKSVAILRDTKGKNGKSIGLGNSKSINQLLAHHGIVFQPNEHSFWVSANPYQLGAFVHYNLDSVFSNQINSKKYQIIAQDPLVGSIQLEKFESFKQIKNRIQNHLMAGSPLALTEEEITRFIDNNADSYLPYYYLGLYFQNKSTEKAIKYLEKALTKETSSVGETNKIKATIDHLRTSK